MGRNRKMGGGDTETDKQTARDRHTDKQVGEQAETDRRTLTARTQYRGFAIVSRK